MKIEQIQSLYARPSAYIAGTTICFAICLLGFTRTTVFAQPPQTDKPFGAADLAQIVGILTSIGIFGSVVIGLIWFVWKGKDLEALTKQNGRLRDEVHDLERKSSNLEKQILELETDAKQAIRDAEKLRKVNLRLQGIDEDDK